MKRMALLTLLLAPSLAGAQQTDQVQTAPHPVVQAAPVGTSVDDAITSDVAPYAPGVVAAAERGLLPRYRPTAASTAGWFGDVGFYVLRPQWSGGNPAFAVTTTTETVTPGTPTFDDRITTLEQTDFDHDYSFAPLVSIGYAGRNGLGVRARWWTLGSSDSAGGSATIDSLAEFESVDFAVPSLLGTSPILSDVAELVLEGSDGILAVDGGFRNRLDLDVIDAEGIWDTTVGRSSLLVSAGVRYAHIGQSFDGDVALTTNVSEAEVALRSLHTFNGAGPTVALQAHRMIGQTNLSVYGLSRGSLLYGESRQRVSVATPDGFSVDADPVLFTQSSSASLTSDSLRPVLELEVGTNWTRSLGSFDLFAESGLVGMVWFNAGNAANSDALVASGFGAAGSDSTNHNLGLLGLRFSTGVRF